ncbi:MAG: PspA/IM30 family protein [Myxococcales bacterium]|nr:PspA/IM30 family protein [Myxococcales bacterium]
MGIFKRLATLLKSNINDLISRAENPEKILNQLILDMQESLVEARKQVAIAIAEEKKLRKQLDKELQEASSWEKKAMMAVKAGRDDLAKEALSRKQEHDNLAAEFQTHWEAQKNATDKLRHALRMLNNKIGEAKRKKDLLIAKQRKAQAQEQIRKAMGSLADSGAFDAFSRMEEKISQQEAEAEAAAELSDMSDDLESKFADFEAKHGADDALLALKVKMGMAEAPASIETDTEEDSMSDFDLAELEALEEALAVPAGSNNE